MDLYPEEGKISIFEAYMYTAKLANNDYPREFHPLIDDNGDFIGHHYFETNYFYDENDPDNPKVIILGYNLFFFTFFEA